MWGFLLLSWTGANELRACHLLLPAYARWKGVDRRFRGQGPRARLSKVVVGQISSSQRSALFLIRPR
jgi:hypothetical protein